MCIGPMREYGLSTAQPEMFTPKVRMIIMWRMVFIRVNVRYTPSMNSAETTTNYFRMLQTLVINCWNVEPVCRRCRSSSNIPTTSPAPSCVEWRRTIPSSGPRRRASSRRTSRRWYWPPTTTTTRSFRCSCRETTPLRSRTRSPATAPTASPSRTTTRSSGRGPASTPTAPWPVQPTWRCPAPTPSWPPSSCAKRWRNWRRSRKSSKLVNSFDHKRSDISIFSFCWTGLFFRITLQVMPRSRSSAKELLRIADAGFFTGWMLFLSSNQQCQSIECETISVWSRRPLGRAYTSDKLVA